MATVVNFPSNTLRALPSFRFSIPEGWSVSEHPRVVAAVRAPAATGGVHANAMVNVVRVDAATDLAGLAAASVARAAASGSDPVVETARTGDLRGRRTHLHAVSFTAGDPARRVAQLHSVFAAPSGGAALVDVVSVVGTCPADEVETWGPAFVAMVASFEFPSA